MKDVSVMVVNLMAASARTAGTIFDIGHASGPILAGLLIAQLDYLYAFWIMSAILLTSIPVFMIGVKE